VDIRRGRKRQAKASSRNSRSASQRRAAAGRRVFALAQKTHPFPGARVRRLANYAPLNYEWHGIMEIINGARSSASFRGSANADEPARRFAARINATSRCRASSTGTRSQQKSSSAITAVESAIRFPAKALSHATTERASGPRLHATRKKRSNFDFADVTFAGPRGCGRVLHQLRPTRNAHAEIAPLMDAFGR